MNPSRETARQNTAVLPLTALLLLVAAGGPSHAEILCDPLLLKATSNRGTVGLSALLGDTATQALDSLGPDFRSQFHGFSETLGNTPTSWLLANIFFDREQVVTAEGRETQDLLKLWDSGGNSDVYSQSPFRNFRDAFYLRVVNEAPELTFESLLDLQKSLMKRTSTSGPNIENIADEDLGRVRNVLVGFNAAASIAPRISAQLEGNPFIAAQPAHSTSLRVFFGYGSLASYTRFKDWLPVELVAKIVEWDTAGRDTTAGVAMIPEVVEALTREALRRHAQAIASAADLDTRVRAHSDLVHNLISIHPFRNGNGRTFRLLLAQLLAKEGIPPPILRSSDDVILSQKAYFERVLDGIRTSRLLMADMLWRKRAGLDPRGSIIPLLPLLPRYIQLEAGKYDLDPLEYAQFIRLNPGDYKNEIERLRKYVAHARKWSVLYKKKSNLEPFQVKHVPDEMKLLHLSVLGKDAELWRGKIGRFYEKQRIHRGLSLRQSMSDEQLLAFFSRTQGIYLSMKAGRSDTPETAIREDMDRFNQLMAEPDKLIQLADDHMNATGDYGQSIFLSTSKDIKTATRFSRGFMMSEAYIRQLKGQLRVSALKPRFGSVDLNRLNPVAQNLGGREFRSRYPRQQELMVAGSLAPDSIMEVEFTDVNVKTVETNGGQKIAGDTEIVKIRRLFRDESAPNVIVLQVLDKNRNVLDETRHPIQ